MVRLGPAFIVVKLSNEQQHAIHAWSEETSYLILLVDKTFVKRVAISGLEHARYIDEVAVTARPKHLDLLMKVLEAQGNEVVDPSRRAGLHPLVVPLALGPPPLNGAAASSAQQGREACIGLLRWPEGAASRGMPVVRTVVGSPTVSLLARSAEEYVHRALAEEAASGAARPLAGQLGEVAGQVYEAGAVNAVGAGTLDTYLTRRAGMYPDVVERLVAAHLAKGDEMSALITGEWYMRKEHFPGWGRPYEFNARLYSSIQRHEEARDCARVALRMPWWTLELGFPAVAALAEMDGGVAGVRAALEEQSSGAAGGTMPPGMVASKDDRQLAMEEADQLLNGVAGGEGDWDSIRPQLSKIYAGAGMMAIARFIEAAA